MWKIAAALVALVLWGGSARAQNVDAGLWWVPALSGWGLAIDQQNGSLVIIAYTYDSNRSPIWYFSNGTMTSNTTYSGRAYTFTGGQCGGCSYTAPTVLADLGAVSVTFTPALSGAPATTGVLTFGGASYAIERFVFNLGDYPYRMLGQWGFVSRVNGVGLGAIYTLTQVASATTGGTGRFGSTNGLTVGQCYTSGTLAGLCELADFSSSGSLQAYLIFDPKVTNTLVGLYYNGSYWPTLGFRVAARAAVTSTSPNLAADTGAGIDTTPKPTMTDGRVDNMTTEILDPRFLVTQIPGWAESRAALLKAGE
jgi:hypothetical protein